MKCEVGSVIARRCCGRLLQSRVLSLVPAADGDDGRIG